ncbi:MAG: hypothetical protein D6788_04210 [Planctomycetota bacterium]|nr:MAG: hypothetical protein D6788_04210 [Planctomycetota bacterium]
MAMLVASAVGAGCAAPGPTPQTYTVRRFPITDHARLLTAVRNALEAEGLPVARIEDDTITTRPRPVPPAERIDLPSRPLGRARDLWRSAVVRLVETEEGYEVYCKVLLRERVTETHRVIAMDARGMDTPVATPIEREGATTAEQNTVWRDLRRERTIERRILNAVRKELQGKDSEGSASSGR